MTLGSWFSAPSVALNDSASKVSQFIAVNDCLAAWSVPDIGHVIAPMNNRDKQLLNMRRSRLAVLSVGAPLNG
jgi:hypothetical protein